MKFLLGQTTSLPTLAPHWLGSSGLLASWKMEETHHVPQTYCIEKSDTTVRLS